VDVEAPWKHLSIHWKMVEIGKRFWEASWKHSSIHWKMVEIGKRFWKLRGNSLR